MNFLSLSTVFTNITKSFSAGFWLAGVFPTMSFLIFNSGVIWILSSSFRAEADFIWKETTLTRGAFLAAVAAIFIVLIAYSLVALATRLRKLLEGEWPPFLENIRKQCIRRQSEERAALELRIRTVFDYRRMEVYAESWREQVRRARNLGSQYCSGKLWPAGAPDPLRDLRDSRMRYELISDTGMSDAVIRLQNILVSYDADTDSRLDNAQLDLFDLLDYAISRAQQEHFQLFNFVQLNYGSGMIAPTRMGNIAASIQAYAVKRYNFNLELFWSSLQKCVQKDEKFSAVLEDAKTRLDFLIISFWLTVLFTAFWGLLLPLVSHLPSLFLTIVLVGPAAAFLWHRAAVEQYRALADAMKTTIDLFRVDLLETLHIRRPEDVNDEREIWKYLNGVSAYDEEGNFRFEFPART